MNPSKFGDTYEMAKMCFLRWLAPDQPWAIHPMYFPKPGKPYNANFPAFYANFLGISCVEGNIVGRAELCNAVLGWTGSLFLDPDTGLWLNPGNRKHVGIQELITIADSATLETTAHVGLLTRVLTETTNMERPASKSAGN